MITRIHFLAVLFLLCGLGYSQPFEIGHQTITFVDPSRGDRSIETEIYYPADTSGDNVSVTATPGTFPVLSFGHGFVMGVDAYENIWTNLVPQGFFMALPTTEGSILPSHLEFARDLAFVINQLELAGLDPTSIFYNRVGPMSAVMGHSMGGGAALLAASLDSGIDALAVLAPAETNPSAIEAAAAISSQSLIMAGGNDCVTPPDANQLPMYDALASGCKTYISITGGSHCQMANSNFLCSFGEFTCSPSPDISRDEQHAIINNYLGKWLASTLKADCAAGALFDEQIISDSSITFQKICILCEPLSTAGFVEDNIKVYPNPFSNEINIDFTESGVLTFTLNDCIRKVYEKSIASTQAIDLNALASGVYFYKISKEGKVLQTGKLIKE